MDRTLTLDPLIEAAAGNVSRANEALDAASHTGLFGRRAALTTGTTWAYYGGRIAGTQVAHGTVALSTGTNYVVAHRTTNVVTASTSTTNWNDTATYRRLYRVTVASGQVSDYEDHRLGQHGVVSTGSQGREARWVPAELIRPSVSGGCAALAVIAIAASRPDIRTLDFDQTTVEYAQFSVQAPKRWNRGTVTFKAVWSHAAGGATFGVAFSLQGVAVSDNESINVAFGTAQTAVDTGGTADRLYTTPESSAITIAGSPAAEDHLYFRVARETANAGDTLNLDARLHGIIVYFNNEAENDA